MSDFGKGLGYCLGMFLAHTEMRAKFAEIKKVTSVSMAEIWFNGSSDHLYDLQIPKEFPIELKYRVKTFKEKVLTWGHGFPKGDDKAKDEDIDWAIEEAKELLRLIDENNGIKTEKAKWA